MIFRLLTMLAVSLCCATISHAQLSPPAGYAMRFNGTNAYVRVPDNNLLDFSQAATLETWVRMDVYPRSGTASRFIHKGDGLSGCSDWSYGVEYTASAGGGGFHYTPGCGYVTGSSDGPLPLGTWVHLAYTFDIPNRRVVAYRNGVQQYVNTTDGRSIRIGSQPLDIGGDPRYSGFLLNGMMDEVRLWNVVRTPEQIAASFATTVPPNSPGLVAYYNFDQGPGSTVFDQTENGLHGVVQGTPTWEQITPPCTSPAVTIQPVSQSACVGSSVTLTTSISGTAPTLQWRKNGVNIVGANSASLAIPSVSVTSAGAYDCIATNSCGNVTTSQAVLTVNAQTSITAQPQAQALVPGATAIFQVTATGAGLAYQWRRDGSALTGSARIGGVNSNTLTIATVAAGDQGLYDCVITGTCGNATSSAASLGCGPVFTQQPQGGSVVGGSSITLSTNVLTAGATTYRWRKNGVNIFNSQTYSGVLTSTLVINVNDPNDAGVYTVAVSNSCGSVVSGSAPVNVICLADFTRDGNVDGDDVIEFFAAWDAALPSGDINEDGSTDGDDVIALFDRWDRGC